MRAQSAIVNVGGSLRKLARSATMVLVLLTFISFGGAAPNARHHPPAISHAPLMQDPLGALRGPLSRPGRDYWPAVGEALKQLETIEGASYSARYGVLTLHGKPATGGSGPFHLDDLMLALQAVFFQREAIAVSIDPDPKNPKAPMQAVNYFGGCQDTALGWLMFECDRILKSCAQGRDSLTKAALHPKVPGFHTMLELGRMTGVKDQTNRFWICFSLQEAKSWHDNPAGSNGWQPVLCETEDGSAVSVEHCRLYVRTELMSGPRGGQGVVTEAAKAFANHFTNHFDEFAALFPELRRLQQIAPLFLIAEWIDKENIPVDLESIRSYRQQALVQTPPETPAITVDETYDQPVKDGVLIRSTIRGFGGVELSPRAFFARDADGRANSFRKAAALEIGRHPSELTWTVAHEGIVSRLVEVPTLRTALAELPSRLNVGVELRRPKDDSELRSDLFPGVADEAMLRADRVSRVPVEQISLAAIDQMRSPPARGPPGEVELVLRDQRHLPQAERISKVGVELAVLRPQLRPDGTATRAPPIVPKGLGTLPVAARIECVGIEAAALKPHAYVEALEPGSPPRPRHAGPSPERVTSQRVERIGLEDAKLAERIGAPVDLSQSSSSLPLFTDNWGGVTFNLPRLREHPDVRLQRTVGIQGKAGSELLLPKQLALLSPLGDIAVEFADPQIDQQRGVMFYPPTPPYASVVKGYYPKTRNVELLDGTAIQFDARGLVRSVRGPDGQSWEFTYGNTPVEGCFEPLHCRFKARGEVEAQEFDLVPPHPARGPEQPRQLVRPRKS